MMDNPYVGMTLADWTLMLTWAAILACVLVVLVVLRLGPTRWPAQMRETWARHVSADTQKAVMFGVYTSITWLLLGIVIGSSLINPLARFLRSLIPN
jgi:ABC-type antimicrobial peptide transport system permease subunit